ncbi:DUF1583 domain-containing protein [Roseiconus nitratireducens]|uniref:DUF1583 domain-containing protein n=1 Tax=Roseiconus nitratireducens TaxID=2605748 RepID=A0A5M6DBI9_9BACT|nr:DUF1583 domain-containing protein [Roseiconus nitratireducens]KAA5543866.1 DUF1583 domain-containing protein [Roseiconus nitratireducens]
MEHSRFNRFQWFFLPALLVGHALGQLHVLEQPSYGAPPTNAEPKPKRQVAESTRPAASDSGSLQRIFGRHVLAENVDRLRADSAGLPPAERYRKLAAWVLPGDSQLGFRMTGRFIQTDPSPLALQRHPVRFQGTSRGGTLVSPVFDLLDAAEATGKLAELRATVADRSAEGSFQQRSRWALLFMIDLKLGDEEAASIAADKLFQSLKDTRPKNLADMWPETLAVYWADRRFPNNRLSTPLIEHLFLQRRNVKELGRYPVWHEHLAALVGHKRILMLAGEDAAAIEGMELEHWIPIERATAWTRGAGTPPSQWQFAGKELFHVSGHNDDYLVFQSPLRGEFAFEGEIGSRTTTQFLAAGQYFGPRQTQEIEVGTFRDGSSVQSISQTPLTRQDETFHFRASFEGGRRTISINGQEVHSQSLAKNHDPWVGFRSWGRNTAQVVHAQVSGDPQVPDRVSLATSRELSGWVSYQSEPVGAEDAIWRLVDSAGGTSEIHGRRWVENAGSWYESQLRYFRPLVEDGRIEYEFFYQPGQVEVHPSFDRQVFILRPDGVRLHWMTDGKHDRTDVRPDHLLDAVGMQPGATPLPLLANDWNRMSVAVSSGSLTLTLNGQPVFQCEAPRPSRRSFGLFHYADQTEVRVRNVTLEADWPKRVPDASGQALADPFVAALDEQSEELKSVFTHDFTKDGLPEEFFTTRDSDGGGVMAASGDGVAVTRPGSGRWAGFDLITRFSLEGDFDIEAGFEALNVQSDVFAAIQLVARLDDQRQSHCRLTRTRLHDVGHRLNVSVSQLHPDGSRTYPVSMHKTCDAAAGRMRLSRRGDVVHYLFAEQDSEVFQYLASETVSDRPTHSDGVLLSAMCNGNGSCRVVWKSLTLRAEQLMYLAPKPEQEQQKLWIMNHDGSDVRMVASPAPGFTHLGSAEFSPDGRHIVCDMSTGSTRSSHIFRMNLDGSGLRDLGEGCMPSYSPDGKRLVLSLPGSGVVVMDADGSNRRIVDQRAWGAEWSPVDNRIVYAKSGNLIVLDVATGQTHELLTAKATGRFSTIYWNMGWSPDGQSIGFKGRNRQTGDFEIGVVRVTPPPHYRSLLSRPDGPGANCSWTPDGRHVVVSMYSAPHGGARLFRLARDETGKPELLPDQPVGKKILDCEWSPDGTRMLFSGVDNPVPVPWTGK